jgi:hypothetical protein
LIYNKCYFIKKNLININFYQFKTYFNYGLKNIVIFQVTGLPSVFPGRDQLRINETFSNPTINIAPNDRGKAPIIHDTNPASVWGKSPATFVPTHRHGHSAQQLQQHSIGMH